MLRQLHALWMCLLVAGICHAQTSRPAVAPDVVIKGKKATALVDLGDRSATAFCIDPSGIFVTSAHVVESANKEIKLILNANNDNELKLTATVLRKDTKSDLAVLKATGGKSLTSLELGSIDGLIETMDVSAYGYPFGKSLSAGDGYPDITVSTGKVTSLRKQAGKLVRIQLDASLNPGCSGGPILDKDGKVVGIVQSGVYGAVVNFAVPVNQLQELLEKPEISVTLPESIKSVDQAKPLDVKVRLIQFVKPAADISMSLSVKGPDGVKSVTLKPGSDGVYSGTFVPVTSARSPKVVTVSAAFENGSLEGTVDDQTVEVDGAKVSLSQIQAAGSSPSWQVTCADGKILKGMPKAFEAVKVRLGAETLTVNLSKATAVKFTTPAEPGLLSYKLTVLSGKRMLHEAEGSISIDGGSTAAGTSSAGGGAVTMAPTRIKDKTEKKLPDTVSDIVMAGGGRYLLLTMPKTRKVAVFDAVEGDIIKYLPVDSDNVLVAGGLDKMLIISPDKNVIQRFDLKTFQKELTTTVPLKGTASRLAMGHASSGPAILSGGGETVLLDLKSLKAVPLKGDNMHPFSIDAGSQFRVSADGSLVGSWRTNSSPSGMTSIQIGTAGKVKVLYEHNSYGAIVPSADGSCLFTGGGIFSPDLKPLEKREQQQQQYSQMMVPASQGPFYLRMTSKNDNGAPNQSAEYQLSLCILGESRALYTLPDTVEGPGRYGDFNSSVLTPDKRFHYIPAAQLLVVVPATNDRLILRRLDLLETLKKSEIDYLFVSSTAPNTATKGSLFKYKIQANARKSPVKFSLESGPKGMSVDADGTIVWKVPADQDDEQVTVIVKIKDQADQETFHTFQLELK